MEIQEIKNRLSIEIILSKYNLTPDKHHKLCCPFHEEKTPSFTIYPKTNTFHCFGCGKTGDTIEFIQLLEKCTKHEAILRAQGFIGLGAVEPAPQPKPEPPMPTEEKIAILTRIFETFKNGLHHGVTVRPKEYLKKRSLYIDLLEMGYNSGQFHHHGKLSRADQEACVKAGLLIPYRGNVPNGNDETFTPFAKDCIIFPLKNQQDQIVSIYGRSITGNDKSKHYYLKDRCGLYPGYPKPDTTRLILTEAIIDAATLLQTPEIANHYSVLACYGTNGLTGEHTGALSQLKELKEVIFFFDGDKSGEEGIKHHFETLHKLLPEVTISQVDTPQEEDVNSLLQGHTPEIFTDLLENRQPLFLLSELVLTEKKEITLPYLVTEQVSATIKATKKDKKIPSLYVANPYRIEYTTDTARYTVKGSIGKGLDSLRVSLTIAPNPEHNLTALKYRTKVDLYEDKQVQKLSHEAAEKLGLRSDLLELDLNRFTDLLEEHRDTQLKENGDGKPKENNVYVPFAVERGCMAFLTKPALIRRINQLIGTAGVAGEENSRILLFVIASSYKMPDTLHALIQGTSGSGKTKLLKTISQLMPPEDVKSYTRVTDNSFYNQDEYFFVHKLLCFEDIDGLKEEAQLAVRELQSNEILVTSTSIKDENGAIRGGERTVRGPIASLACTTHGELYEDNVSRCFVIAVDESEGQTLRVIQFQNDRAAGIIDIKKEQQAREFLQNCIRMLKPYQVINPYANKIHLPPEAHKLRRLNELYQSFVKQITLLSQYQRKKDAQGRIITEKEDLHSACEILFESILLKVDELDGSLRQFYEKLKSYINDKGKDYEFNRFEVRTATGVSKTQQHYYINRLIELEYIRQYGFANRGFKYKIAHWDNMSALRARIKESLEQQLQKLT
jgi:DNA primase catalytic core